ncbi:hypothetical protein MBLNU459_g7412t1 [Dothideomycetes sp. NU459]
MSRRQLLVAVGPGRPVCPTFRISAVRFASSEGQPANSSQPARPAQEQTSTPFTQENYGRSRQQRAAQVSEEVRMLSRGSPSAKVRGNNSPNPATRSRTIDPSAIGAGDGRRAQMGRNSSAGREGPFAQRTGRDIRAGKGGFQNRSERTPGGAPGRGRVLRKNDEFAEAEQEEDAQEIEDAPTTAHELTLLEQFDKEQIGSVAFEPAPVTREEYLHLGQGGATIAGNNFEGVVEDRLKLLAESTQDGFRWAPDIAARMMKGQFVSFESEAEKADVVAAAERYAQNRADAYSEQKGGEAVEKREFDFAPVVQKSQAAVVDKLVRGKYGDLNAAGYKQDVLNHIARNTLRNPTYLEDDGNKLLKKIRSLLPAETATARKPAPKPRK